MTSKRLEALEKKLKINPDEQHGIAFSFDDGWICYGLGDEELNKELRPGWRVCHLGNIPHDAI